MVRPSHPAPSRGAAPPRARLTAATESPAQPSVRHHWRGAAVAAVVCVAVAAVTLRPTAAVVVCALVVIAGWRLAARAARATRAERNARVGDAYERASGSPWVQLGDDEVNVETGDVRRSPDAAGMGGQSNRATMANTSAAYRALATDAMPAGAGGQSNVALLDLIGETKRLLAKGKAPSGVVLTNVRFYANGPLGATYTTRRVDGTPGGFRGHGGPETVAAPAKRGPAAR